MDKKYNTTHVSIRIPTALLDRIKDDVNISKEYFSMSDWIITACRRYEVDRMESLLARHENKKK